MEKLRLLIADDDSDARKRIVELLSGYHDIVAVVGCGDEMVRAALCLMPDVILSEILTPRINAVTVRGKLLARGTLIPVVFVSYEGHEVVGALRREAGVAFVYKSDIGTHLLNAIEAAYNGWPYYSPFYLSSVLDQKVEDQDVVLVDGETLRKAEQMVVSCEGCNPAAEIPFDQLLDQLTGSDPWVTNYILQQLGRCPACFSAITEKTLVEICEPR
jgi:CheY-like chemotaxis protein